MLLALEKGLTEKPEGMGEMVFSADVHDGNTITILQSWESKVACLAFQSSLSTEQAAGFAALVATKAECWHHEILSLATS